MANWSYPAILGEAQPFSGLPAEALEAIWRAGEVCDGAAGEPLFHQGDDAARCYVLLHGVLKMVQVTEGGAEVVVGFITPGEMFGCVAAFRDTAYPASALCVGPCRAVGWLASTWRSLAMRYPRMALNAAATLGGRLETSRERMTEMATKSSAQRIASAVLRIARGRSDLPTDEVVMMRDLHVSRQDIAGMTGTGLYTVSRTLQEWARQGIVDVRRERVAVCDVAALRGLARGERG